MAGRPCWLLLFVVSCSSLAAGLVLFLSIIGINSRSTPLGKLGALAESDEHVQNYGWQRGAKRRETERVGRGGEEGVVELAEDGEIERGGRRGSKGEHDMRGGRVEEGEEVRLGEERGMR